MTVFERLHMPPLGGATEWLGHVVVVDIWTLTCINWLRTEPYVRAWSQAYRDDGLVVIGIHTPEFSFEHEIERVRLATKERGIDYPVAVDNDYEIWSAFDNHYWPALYFIDADGIIRDHHFGEGRSGVARDSDISDRGRGIGHCGKGRPWQRSLGGSLDGGASRARD
jgi:thiol-disulfide isomerase/thioredoxin